MHGVAGGWDGVLIVILQIGEERGMLIEQLRGVAPDVTLGYPQSSVLSVLT